MNNAATASKLAPKYAIYTLKNGKLCIDVDIQGIDPEEINLRSIGNVLTVEFDRLKKKKVTFSSDNLQYGEFSKAFDIAKEYDISSLKHKIEYGVLVLTISTDSDKVKTYKL